MATLSSKKSTTFLPDPIRNSPDLRKTHYYTQQQRNINRNNNTINRKVPSNNNSNNNLMMKNEPPQQQQHQRLHSNHPAGRRNLAQPPPGGVGSPKASNTIASPPKQSTTTATAITNKRNTWRNAVSPRRMTGRRVTYQPSQQQNNRSSTNHHSPPPPSSYEEPPQPQRPSIPSDFPPLVFGGDDGDGTTGGDPSMADTASVNTGTSQQELLRKKARSESKNRRQRQQQQQQQQNQNSKRFGGSTKKKKEPKIVNMPPSLLSGGGMNRSRTSSAGGGAGLVFGAATRLGAGEKNNAHSNNLPSKGRGGGGGNRTTTAAGGGGGKFSPSSWFLNSRTSIDEKESLTAESTVTPESNASSSSTKQHHLHYELPYSSVPAAPAVVHSEDSTAEWMKEQQQQQQRKSPLERPIAATGAAATPEDSRSIDEYSFPLLSTNALGGVVNDEEEDYYNHDPSTLSMTPMDESLLTNSVLDQSTLSRTPLPVGVDPSGQGEPPKTPQKPQPHTPLSQENTSSPFAAAAASMKNVTSAAVLRRNVRFSKVLEQSTFFLQDEHSAATSRYKPQNSTNLPSNQQQGSPQSVLDHPNYSAATPSPKSILRDSKYKPQTHARTTLPHNRDPEYLRFYLHHANAALAAAAHEEPQQQPPSPSMSTGSSPSEHFGSQQDDQDDEASTPQFLDHSGSELSPIRRRSDSSVGTNEKSQKHHDFAAEGSEGRHLDDDHLHDQTTPRQESQQQQEQSVSFIGQQIEQYHPEMSFHTANDNESIASARLAFIEAVAAVVIQTAYRRHVAREYVLYLLHLRDQEQAELSQQEEQNQSTDNSNTLQQSTDEISLPTQAVALRMYTEAAILIQAAFRGFWARDCLNVDLYCATAIQRIYRGYTARLNYHYDRYRVITVQSVWRKCIARERVAYVLAYAILIQSAVRGFLVRKAMLDMEWRMSYYLAYEAATLIQKNWRMYFCWVRYNKLLCASTLQSVVRGWLARKQVASMRAAANTTRQKNTPFRRAKQQQSQRHSLRSTSPRVEEHPYRAGNGHYDINSNSRVAVNHGCRGFGGSSIKDERSNMQRPVNVGHYVMQSKNTSQKSTGRAPFQESTVSHRMLSPSSSVSSNTEVGAGGRRTGMAKQHHANEEAISTAGYPSMNQGFAQSRDANSSMDSSRRAYSSSNKPTSSRLHRLTQCRRPPVSNNSGQDGSGGLNTYRDQNAARETLEGTRARPPSGSTIGRVSQNQYKTKQRDFQAPSSSRSVVQQVRRLEQTGSFSSGSVVSPEQNFAEATNVVLNKSGDEYEWAYEVWYQMGLLDWTPVSRHEGDR